MNLSVPQLISPLLDGFVMGDPISNHDGVRACPAMQLETDKKYIVKIISLPATQSKLDALLLAGAFTDRASAVDYFKELADGVLEEAELLQKLSRHEGFVSFDSWQMVPMEDDETGFDIYLLGQYRPTLEGVFRTNEMTHLQAVNLGLDLCAALSAARRFGYLYSNLRPSNIYICNDREFRIGDLGFLSLDSLSYASLPDKYHSDYTPPEISDAYSALNGTMDTYAVGLILYQAYNDGRLPAIGMSLSAPRYADPALAEIILKACAVDPAERWQDPAQMGQALAAYMQANTVNDTPIVPPVIEEEEPEVVEEIPEEDPQPSTDDILAEVDEALDNAPPIIPSPEPEEEQVVEEVAEVIEEAPAEDAEPAVEEVQEELPSDEPTEEAEEVSVEEEPAEVEEEQDETAQMLAQADELIAYQLPDPPVAPDPIEVTLPETEEIVPEVAEEEEPVTEETPEEPSTEEAEEQTISEEAEVEEEELEESEEETPKKQNKRLKIWAIVLSVILVLVISSFLFIRFFYLQTIDSIALTGKEDRLTVTLTTQVDDELLSVLCTDTHGNTLTANVENGVAQFVGLKSGTKYNLEVRIKGFHKLLGKTKESYTTATQTVITGFYAAIGPEDSSVILSFTIQGPDAEQWKVNYSADGEEAKDMTFTGHVVTLNGLTAGKEYTFTLKPATQLYLSGTDTIKFTASKVVYAEEVEILGYQDGKLLITWKGPEDVTVPKWYIRCYNDAGFDKTMTVTETAAALEGLVPGTAYIIEVTAEGMSLGIKTEVSANAGTITELKADASDRNNLKVTWNYEGSAPAGGWLLTYTIEGSAEQKTITCTEMAATITPLIPGAHYTITVKPADGASAFGGNLEYDAPAAPAFSGFLVNADNIEVSMCKTPNKADWTRKDVTSYTTSFKVGESASFVMHVDRKTSQPSDSVITLYVIRDAEGNLINANSEARTWDEMWDDRYAEFTIPAMPDAPGSYTVEIYFNGTAVTTQSFEITA